MPIKYNHPKARKKSKELLAQYQECWRCKNAFGLSVHHDDRNRLNNKDSNVFVLCERCHARVHSQDKKYGKKRGKVTYSLFSEKQLKELTIKRPKK
ncbi:hypothetical protein [Xanthocytophaga agilis]|uniref:HNH nuclease domain-containing protein n=1 Tax=Xanthocytophaga agilis TaxID=3048010 RepID=A0AAE3UIX0_9BACT|nr:hypothetical protein [Xanthocytophaga agilis]MDJ1505022.1 hypothetical protein [Xanthocytophaga agilis]